MSALNATGHVLLTQGVDDLWDLLDELSCIYHGKENATCGVHSLGAPRSGLERYCVHPTGEMEQEFRGDNLEDTLRDAAAWLARELDRRDPDLCWRRT